MEGVEGGGAGGEVEAWKRGGRGGRGGGVEGWVELVLNI